MLFYVVVTTGVIGVAMLAMAVGVIVSGRRLRGSCGGLGADCLCEDVRRREGHRPENCPRKSMDPDVVREIGGR